MDYSGISSENTAGHEELRSCFEQDYLYCQITVNSDNLSSNLKKEDYEIFCSAIYSFWDANLYFYAVHQLTEQYDEYNDITDIPDDVFNAYMNGLINDCRLYVEDNMAIIVEGAEEGPALLLIEMAEDTYEGSCLYIAVVFDEDGNIKYYTLEKTSGEGYSLCEKTASSSGYLSTNSSVTASLDKNDEELKMTFLQTVCDDYFS